MIDAKEIERRKKIIRDAEAEVIRAKTIIETATQAMLDEFGVDNLIDAASLLSAMDDRLEKLSGEKARTEKSLEDVVDWDTLEASL